MNYRGCANKRGSNYPGSAVEPDVVTPGLFAHPTLFAQSPCTQNITIEKFVLV